MAMKKYKLVSKKGEGTFSEVVKAENVENGKFYAIKCMKNSFKNLKQVNNLREIQALRKLAPHANIIHLEEVLFDAPSGRLAMVFELMEANLYDLISGRREHLDAELVRSIGYQIFTALKYMHDRSIFHRDIKPENILIDKGGKVVKLADFGSCRSTHSKPPFTEYIATRWYRSPECLLTEGHYGAPMDVWGAGCVLFEITALFPLFPGADEVDQIHRIHKVVGTPEKDLLVQLIKNQSSKMDYNFKEQSGVGIRHFIPHASPQCYNLIKATLEYDYTKRIESAQACNHEYFDSLRGNTTPKNTSKKIGTAGSPTSVRNLHLKDSREEKPSHRSRSVKTTSFGNNPSNRTRDDEKTSIDKIASQRFTKTKKITPMAVKPQPLPTSMPKGKPKPVYPPIKPKQQTNKSPGRFVSRLLSKSKTVDTSSNRNNKPFHTRLPKLEKGTNNKKPDTKLLTKSNQDSSKLGTTARRKNKYNHVSSSGYGRSTYKPTNLKSLNPSATSTLTDPTATTSAGTAAGTSNFTSSKSFGGEETHTRKKIVKHGNSSNDKRQLAAARRKGHYLSYHV